MALKRKVMGLTMLVEKEYNTKHKHVYTTYTFINPVSNYVYNTIMSELGTIYNMVVADVKEEERETEYGSIEVYIGSIKCYNAEQRKEYMEAI